MDGIPTPATPARRPKGAPGRSRGKSRKPVGGSRNRLVRRLLVFGVAAIVFAAAFILDTGAVARLLWLCLKGQAGEPARLGAGAVVVLLVGLTGLAVYRPAPPAKPRKKTARTAVPPGTPAKATDEPPPAGKRGGKRTAQAAADRGA